MGDSFALAVLQCLDKCKIFLFIAIRTSVVRTLVPLLTDLRLRNKLDDLDIARRWRLEFFEILFSENDVLPGLDFVAFPNLLGRHFLTGIRIDHMLLHTFLRTIVEHVETHGLVLHGGVKLHRQFRRAEFYFTFPDRACGHEYSFSLSSTTGAQHVSTLRFLYA